MRDTEGKVGSIRSCCSWTWTPQAGRNERDIVVMWGKGGRKRKARITTRPSLPIFSSILRASFGGLDLVEHATIPVVNALMDLACDSPDTFAYTVTPRRCSSYRMTRKTQLLANSITMRCLPSNPWKTTRPWLLRLWTWTGQQASPSSTVPHSLGEKSRALTTSPGPPQSILACQLRMAIEPCVSNSWGQVFANCG